MGQKASSQEDASGVGGVRHARCCACSDQPRANRKDDTIQVTIVAPDLEAPVGSPSESRIQRQPPFGEGFGCGLGQRRGPVVEVVDILPRSAVVRWHWENNARPQQLTAYYVFLVRLPSCDPLTPDAKTSNVDEFFFLLVQRPMPKS